MFSSCEQNNVTEDFLEGKWRLTHINISVSAGGEVVEEDVIDLTEDEYIIYEFTKDGRFIMEGEDFEATYSLSKDGSKIVIDYDDGEKETYNVHKVSNKEMELSTYLVEDYDGVTYTYEETMVLKKQ